MRSFIVWFAQGFGLGRIPWAPGTFGSLGGLLWFLILLLPGSLWFFAAGTLAGLLVSVWFCGKAEEILEMRDPGSIVLDEIAAIPLCYVPWLVSEMVRTEAVPEPAWFILGNNWAPTLVIFAMFRFFDILKPWPVRQSQSLRGGWGVTADDFLAACYVCVLTLLVFV